MTEFSYELIYVSVLSALITSVAAPALGIGDTGLAGVAAGVVAAGVMTAYKKLGWSVRFVMTGVLVAVTLTIVLLSRVEAIGLFFMAHISLLWLLLPAVGGFAAGELCARIRAVRVAASVASVAACIAATAMGYAVDKITVIATLALILIVITEEIQISWDKSGDTDHRLHLVWVSPFLLCVMILTAVCHAPAEPYDWGFVKTIYRYASEKMMQIGDLFGQEGAYDPAAAMIGFSGRGEIHGEVKKGSGDVLILYDIPSGMSSVKLTGRTFDTFDGYTWTDSDTSDQPDVMLDTLSMLASVYDYSSTPTDYVKKSSLRIVYDGIHTSYVFAPLKSLTGGRDLTSEGLYNAGGDLLWPDIRAFKTEYTIPFYRLNTGNPLFAEYLRDAQMPTRESFDLEAGMFTPGGEVLYTYEDLIKHNERIEALYAAPVQLSDEMSERMHEVYGDADCTYDKMLRLEEYLRTLEYSDSPGQLPAGLDEAGFLDYFIADSGCGYCTHFATAFVLLARAEGIPARYVQGYIADIRRSDEVRVGSSKAHAWPEVYYEGAGWIPYEPTPIYTVSSYWRSADEIRAMYDEVSQPVPDQEEEEEIASAEDQEDADEGIHIPWYAIVVPLSAGMLLTLMFIIAGNLIVSAGFKRKDDKDKLVMLCRQDMRLLDLLECPIEEGETLQEMRGRLSEELNEDALGFIPFYSEYLYRGDTDMQRALEASGRSGKQLRTLLKKLYPLRYLKYYMGFQRG